MSALTTLNAMLNHQTRWRTKQPYTLDGQDSC
jgi:hypothetical protein